MKAFLLLVCIAAVGFYLGPTFMEGADSQCEALISHALKVDPPSNRNARFDGMALSMIGVLGPPIVKQIVKKQYPSFPPQLSCAGLYWKAFIDPQSLENYWTQTLRQFRKEDPPRESDLLQTPAQGRATARP